MSYKTLIRSTLRHAGYDIFRLPKASSDLSQWPAYDEIKPVAAYAPWMTDLEFMALYERIKQHTHIDIYRLYELWTLAAETAPLGGDMIEIGVWRGGSAAILNAKSKSLNLPTRLFACDTFYGVVKAGVNDSSYRGGEHRDTSLDLVQDFFKALQLDTIDILQGIFPEETGSRVADSKFCLVHIDVDVYLSAKDCLEFLWPKILKGGVVVFDDYGLLGCEGVTKLVEEQRSKSDRLVLHNLNGHGLLVKRD